MWRTAAWTLLINARGPGQGEDVGVAQLAMFGYVAVGTESHEVVERIVPLVAAKGLVMNLKILERAALLASPAVPLQYALHQPPIDLLA